MYGTFCKFVAADIRTWSAVKLDASSCGSCMESCGSLDISRVRKVLSACNPCMAESVTNVTYWNGFLLKLVLTKAKPPVQQASCLPVSTVLLGAARCAR
jgi:hypothetical protein